MKKSRIGVLVLGCLCALLAIWLIPFGSKSSAYKVEKFSAFKVEDESNEFEFEEDEKEEEESENPLKRILFEYEMLKNPSTGEVPENIRTKELEFVKSIAVQNNRKALRSSAAGVEQSNASNFVNRGPYNVGGRTRALAIDVSDENVILAGAVSGGVWRSTNKGSTWTRTSSVSQLPSVTTIVQDKRAGKTSNWYYGTGEFFGNSANFSGAFYLGDGIHKSTDGGKTWSLIQATSTGQNVSLGKFGLVHDMAIDYSNTSETEIYVAGVSEIIRTTDDFQSYQTVLGVSNEGYNFSDIVVSPTGKVIASISNSDGNGTNAEEGIFISENGTDWTSIALPENFPSSYQRVELFLDPQDENILYTLGNNFLYKYTIDQDSWLSLTNNLGVSEDAGQGHNAQGGYNLVGAVHPDDSFTVFVGGTNLLRSKNAFATATQRTNIGGYEKDDNPNAYPNYPNHHPDIHALSIFPSNPNQMLSGSDGGVHLTTNNLRDATKNPVIWTPLNNGYVTGQFYAVDLMREGRGNPILVGGMQDNGSWITDPESSIGAWQRILGGDGSYSAFTYNSIYVSAQEGQVYRLALEDNTYVYQGEVSPDGDSDNFLFVNPFIHDRVNQDKLFVGAKGKVFYTQDIRENPGEGAWKSFTGSGLSSDFVAALATSVQPEGVLYFGTRAGKVYKVSSTKGDIGQAINITSGSLPSGSSSPAVVSSIAVDPRDANRVFLTYGNYGIVSVWMSENGGGTWTPIAGNLEENSDGSGRGPSVRSIEILPNGESGEMLFVGTSTGLYMTENINGMQTQWTLQAPEEIGKAVVNMVKVRPVDGLVVAATHGNGVFSAKYDVTFHPEINYSFIGTGAATIRAPKSYVSGQGFAFKWFKDGEEITGETDSEIDVDESGTYQCRVSDQLGPVAMSNQITLNLEGEVTGIDDPLDLVATVSPNPSSGVFNVLFDQSFASGFDYVIIDSKGKQISSGQKKSFNTEETVPFDLRSQPDGLYILNVRNPKLNKAIKLLKRSN